MTRTLHFKSLGVLAALALLPLLSLQAQQHDHGAHAHAHAQAVATATIKVEKVGAVPEAGKTGEVVVG